MISLAPSAAPRNVSIATKSPTEVTITWIEVNCVQQNSEILKYSVEYGKEIEMWIIMVFLLWGVDAIVAMTVTAIVYPYAIFFTLCLFLSSWLFLVVFFAFVRHNTHLLLANHRSFVVAVQSCVIRKLLTMTAINTPPTPNLLPKSQLLTRYTANKIEAHVSVMYQ